MKSKSKRAVSLLIAVLFILSAGTFAASAEAKMLVPVGRAVGIKLDSEGVIVVGTPDKCADNATPSPAKAAGFKSGDIIVQVGAAAIRSGEDLKAAASAFDGAPAVVHVRRGGETVQLTVSPAKTQDGNYSLGLWVRDGISGIGTVTFYDPETGKFGALGHAVNDTDTGVRLPVRDGMISGASVTEISKGKSGTPGQLHGTFSFDKKIGNITVNSDCGIFGLAPESFPGPAMEAAQESDIHVGPAYILSNVTGTEVRRYEAEISRVYTGNEANGRSMLVTIRDSELTNLTGGIVQGMSGSPVIQDGKLVGAITHVLIGDPSKGYAVSIQKMLDMADAS